SRFGLVEVLFKFGAGGRAGGDAVGRDFALGGPDDGVEDELAEVVVAPVEVDVGAGEAEAPAAVGPLAGPGNMLGPAATLYHLRLAAARAETLFARRLRRDCTQDRGHALHLGAESHVVVPLVVDRKRLDATRDRMIGQRLEISGPVGIDR